MKLVQDVESAEQSRRSTAKVNDSWALFHFEQDPSSQFQMITGRQPALDPMVLEVGLLSCHRGTTVKTARSSPAVADC
jgi:hypothetical protein